MFTEETSLFIKLSSLLIEEKPETLYLLPILSTLAFSPFAFLTKLESPDFKLDKLTSFELYESEIVP
jgi:hypothetical protein